MLVSRVIVFITLSMRKTKGEIKREGRERDRERERETERRQTDRKTIQILFLEIIICHYYLSER